MVAEVTPRGISGGHTELQAGSRYCTICTPYTNKTVFEVMHLVLSMALTFFSADYTPVL